MTDTDTPIESTERHIVYMTLPELLAADVNPKLHDLEGIGESLDRFGIVETIVLDERTGQLVSGHGRTEKLTQLEGSYREQIDAGVDPDVSVPEGVRVEEDGTWRVPVTRGWASATDSEAEAVIVALNRIGEGQWNQSELYDVLSRQNSLAGIGYDPDHVQNLARELGKIAEQNTAFLGQFGAAMPGLGQVQEQNHDGKTHLAGTAKVKDSRVILEFTVDADERSEIVKRLNAVKAEHELETLGDALLFLIRADAPDA